MLTYRWTSSISSRCIAPDRGVLFEDKEVIMPWNGWSIFLIWWRNWILSKEVSTWTLSKEVSKGCSKFQDHILLYTQLVKCLYLLLIFKMQEFSIVYFLFFIFYFLLINYIIYYSQYLCYSLFLESKYTVDSINMR